MGPEWVSIIALVALFVIGTVLPINMGALAYVAAWLVGMYALDLDEKEILAGVSGDLILTLIGVTYLFAIAKNNGTVDLIVRSAVKAVGGRVAFIPWVMFAVTALLTAIGAVSPAACAIIGPIALGFAGRYKISALMMGMMVVHGAQAGGFSPISIYGTITNSVMAQADLPNSEITIFLASLIVNTVLAAILFFALGGRKLMDQRIDPDDPDTLTEDMHRGGATVPARGMGASAPTGTQALGVRRDQVLTPARISFSSRSRAYMPTSQAATYASAPMLIGSTVPMTKSATNAMIETHSGPMAVLPRSSAEAMRPAPCVTPITLTGPVA